MPKASSSKGTSAKQVDDEWIKSIKRSISSPPDGSLYQEHIICKVHPQLHKQKKSAYEPIATSIGPYHWRKNHLKPMETYKKWYFSRLLSQNPNVFERLVEKIKGNEEMVSNCYLKENIKPIDSRDLIEMILYDGCFLIQLLLEYNGECSGGDLMTGPEWRLSQLVSTDLLLLETQLPFFILQEIFEIVMPDEEHPRELVKVSLALLGKATRMVKRNLIANPRNLKIHHLLHLLHTHSTPAPLTRDPANSGGVWLPGANSLKEAGVKFRAMENTLLDIKFDNGRMEIPKFYVDGTTEIKLRNLIAFELCCLKSCDFYFTSYVSFMDNIVNTSKDVEALHRKKILEHGLGSDDEVAKLFNNLGKEVIVFDERGYLSKTNHDVNEYRNKRRNRWCASLKHNYFYSPWAIVSFITAVLILVFTGTQTVFSVLSYLDPR